MEPKDLLAPRYKVVADYPENVFNVGQIIEQEEIAEGQNLYNMDFFEKFPHLFKKLKWWENRDTDDMPEYVKRLDNGAIIKTDKWFLVGSDMRWHTEKRYVTMSAKTCLPATEEEYNTYLIQQQSKS